MTNREAKLIKDKLEIALVCCSHALEEPASAESYLHIIMDELDLCGRYIEERQAYGYNVKEIFDPDE